VTPVALEEHPIQWVTASALWPHALGTRKAGSTDRQRAYMNRPALLRLPSDDFMDDLARLLETAPKTLSDYEAKGESFRVRPPGQAANWEPKPGTRKLKLYQPVHGDFNLVAASLVCGIPGLPDRGVEKAHGDVVSFVLRRLDGNDELAWVDAPAAKAGRTWSKAVRPGEVAKGEELLPLFPINFPDGDLRRRLFVGLIPTASRETYRNAGVAASPPPAPADPKNDPRRLVLRSTVIDPIAALAKMNPSGAATKPAAEAASPTIVLALAEFLAENVPGWTAILEGTDPAPNAPTISLFHTLENMRADRGRNLTWIAALRTAWFDRLVLCGEKDGSSTLVVNLRDSDAVTGYVSNALPEPAPAPAGTPSAPDPAEAEVPKLNPREEARYVLRCVFQRPQCGPLHQDVVSAPSRDFAIASFFDVDAPQRTVQISMPLDTSPAGLRKATKNVKFLLSDQLKQQMGRVGELKDIMDGKLEDESLDIGLVCSFSIPIITICALIGLMILVQLLNIVFWWLPLFKICLPVGLKGKP
jgi:hypothetical protein